MRILERYRLADGRAIVCYIWYSFGQPLFRWELIAADRRPPDIALLEINEEPEEIIYEPCTDSP